MPDCVENVLHVAGSNEQLTAFRAANAGDDGTLLSFARAVPMPAEWSETQRTGTLLSAPGWSMESEYGDEWWRPWCTQHWGTKCEPLGALVVVEEGCLSYSFETVWAAPAAWVVALAAAHPELTIELYYGEAGNLYSGCMRFVGGAKVGHVGGAYDRFFEFDFDGGGFCEREYEALEAHYDALAASVRHGGPALAAWLAERDPHTHWHLSMRGALSLSGAPEAPLMGGARWCSGVASVTLAELEARRHELGGDGRVGVDAIARRRAAFQVASDAVERCAPLVPEGVYKELYEALQRVHDLV